ncbi:Mannose-6-phosphate isomerase [Quaeritorhiza haematococci]|nr:Mannose-6-phosphate isomerase [Quaeritorhiza haematococci]
MPYENAVVRLTCKTQSYAWGKVGKSSKVSELASGNGGFQVAEDTPYAELWMGTHPNGPSYAIDGAKKPLKELVNRTNLSEKLHSQYEGDLPFLFKVLSIAKALSIQAHPDKALAKDLHTKFPNIYKDPNHKPEMAVALTPFEAFIGFRPLEEIKKNIQEYPEFRDLVGATVADAFVAQVDKSHADSSPEAVAANKKALKALFQALMESSQEKISEHLSKLIARMESDHSATTKVVGTVDELLVRLNKEFPADVGCFCALLLNYVKLAPGEGIFLAANEPHAYLSGDCVECMAASDNVVRSGLTPKFKDVPTLVSMLTYNHGPASSQILHGTPYKTSKTHKHLPNSVLYDPPIDEFSIIRTELPTGVNTVEEFEGIHGPSIVIVTEGQGKLSYPSVGKTVVEVEAEKGYVFFVGADVPITLKGSESGSVTFYRAFCA